MPPYHPNHSYLVYTPEGNSTAFLFGKGEKPQSSMVTCDDGGTILDPSWSSMGVGSSKSYVLTIKAKMTAPRQGCLITTNRGIYSIVIQPTTRTHITKVAWSDPYGFLSEPDPETPDVCGGGDLNYTMAGDPGAFGIRMGDVSNDGSHTCIRFPQSAAFDVPAVWLVEGDNERPASPAMIDNAYVIDGVPPVIELRTDNATLRIERAHR
jgi:type IV secretory pathway VirB9-like protein